MEFLIAFFKEFKTEILISILILFCSVSAASLICGYCVERKNKIIERLKKRVGLLEGKETTSVVYVDSNLMNIHIGSGSKKFVRNFLEKKCHYDEWRPRKLSDGDILRPHIATEYHLIPPEREGGKYNYKKKRVAYL